MLINKVSIKLPIFLFSISRNFMQIYSLIEGFRRLYYVMLTELCDNWWKSLCDEISMNPYYCLIKKDMYKHWEDKGTAWVIKTPTICVYYLDKSKLTLPAYPNVYLLLTHPTRYDFYGCYPNYLFSITPTCEVQICSSYSDLHMC